MRLLTVLIALLLLAPATTAAQRTPTVVTGRVKILDSPRTAAMVLVRIEALNMGALVDSTGHYRFVVPSSRFADGDSVTLVASHVGLRPESRRIRLAAAASIQIDLGLKTQRLDDWFVCDVVVGIPAGTEPLPEGLPSRLCRLTHLVERKLRDRALIPS